MEQAHPFSVNVEPDPWNPNWSRWLICEGEQVLLRSPRSYPTRGEAFNEATAALERAKAQAREND
jgi:hypothetical protein